MSDSRKNRGVLRIQRDPTATTQHHNTPGLTQRGLFSQGRPDWLERGDGVDARVCECAHTGAMRLSTEFRVARGRAK